MELLKQRILQEGKVLENGLLRVDSFLNHQVDMALMGKIASAFSEHFQHLGATRILTVESSGIIPAALTAQEMALPLLILKKLPHRITDGSAYQTNIQSFTKKAEFELTAMCEYLPAGEKILFIDDFLAMGETVIGTGTLLLEARCELVGIGILIEKTFQPGRRRLETFGYDVFSLARIASMTSEQIVFTDS